MTTIQIIERVAAKYVARLTCGRMEPRRSVIRAALVWAATGMLCGAAPAERRPVVAVMTPITGDAIDLEVYPKPRQETYSGQALRLTTVSIEATGLDAAPARRLLDALLDAWGIGPSTDAPGRIALRLIEPPPQWRPAPDQGYRLTVDRLDGAPRIVIEGGGAAGVFYGLQTLRQLVHIRDGVPYAREALIEDWPAIPLRGPATAAETRWKLNMAMVPLYREWPPRDPNQTQRDENLTAQRATRIRLEEIDRWFDEQDRQQDKPVEDLDALLDDMMGGGEAVQADPFLREHKERSRIQLAERQDRLRTRIKELDDAYEKHRAAVEVALRQRVQRYRDDHIEPVIHYKAGHTWGDIRSNDDPLERRVGEITAVYRIGLAGGARHFSMALDIATGYHPSAPGDPTYGELQALLATRVMNWLRNQEPESELFLMHQKDTVHVRPIMGHIASMHIRRCLHGLAEEFAAAGPPDDLQIMWAGCGRPAPHIQAEHARAMSAAFGGRRASFLNVHEGYGRFFIHMQQFWGGSYGVGSFIGNRVMEHHDPALAEHLTHVVIPGWGVRQWGWHPEAYDAPRVTAVKLREWVRDVGGGPAAYRELSALAEWQLEHGHYAMIGLGWCLEAHLGEDQNRLTPDEVTARMTRKRAFYAERLAALRAALPSAGDTLFERIEKEVADRLKHLGFVEQALKARPVGVAVRAAGPVTLDGVLDEPAWEAAPIHGGFKGRLPEYESDTGIGDWVEVALGTRFRVVYTDDHVYVAVSCEEPAVNRINAHSGNDYGSVVAGDYLQLAIDPTGLKRRATQLTTTLHGQTIVGHEGWSTVGRTDPGPLLDWQWPRAFAVKTGKTANGWIAEFAIALNDLDPQYRPEPGRRWGFNVIRRQDVRGGEPQRGIFRNRFCWQQTATFTEYRYGGPTYRGQILYCGALVFK